MHAPARPLRRTTTLVVAAVLALSGVLAHPAQADASTSSGGNVATPGDFTGFGFDQCLAPTQQTMNTWLTHSPFLAVGIYISGKSRGCRQQPNLTPGWVSTQLRKGWRLLPITLGPQASCHPAFPRYDDDVRINWRPGGEGRYGKARRQGRAEASTTVAEARRLGLVAGSTLWYDLEGFDVKKRDCRESAMAFLSGWTARMHALGYVSGVYSSAGSGIKMLDDARVAKRDDIKLPDRIWIARWDGVANTSTSYIRDDGWRPGGRMKQYQGGHNETWGGVTINIDRNWLDLGLGSVAAEEVHCGGIAVDFPAYRRLEKGAADGKLVSALKCLLTEQGAFSGKLGPKYGSRIKAAVTAWRAAHELAGTADDTVWTRPMWRMVLSAGTRPVLKTGSAGADVRRLQRTLNAAGVGTVSVTGVFDGATTKAVKEWQKRQDRARTGVFYGKLWKRLQSGAW